MMHRAQFLILTTATPWHSLFPSECRGGDAHDRLPLLGTWLEKNESHGTALHVSYPNIDKSLHAPRIHVTSTQDSHDQPTMCFHHFKDTHPVTRSRHQALAKEKKNNSCKHKKG
ncbi:hypothetical protein HDV63DRAFT_375512 [Trichoderma sp. SZMC 28014]